MKKLDSRILIPLILAAMLAAAVADEVSARAQAIALVQSTNGWVVLPAREAQTHGSTIRYEPQPHKNTIGYWTKPDDWVSWNFSVTRAAVFEVELTQACGRGSGGSVVVLSVGGQSLTNTVPDTGAFTNFVQRVIGAVKLSAGENYTLTVRPLSKPGLAVMDLRAVTLRPKS